MSQIPSPLRVGESGGDKKKKKTSIPSQGQIADGQEFLCSGANTPLACVQLDRQATKKLAPGYVGELSWSLINMTRFEVNFLFLSIA